MKERGERHTQKDKSARHQGETLVEIGIANLSVVVGHPREQGSHVANDL